MKSSLIALALALAPALVLAQGQGYGPGGGGPGYGPGGGGPGYGPGGYGPGGGWGPGMGPGMMHGQGGLGALNLTSEQSDRIAALREEARKKNWGTMGELRSEMFRLQRMMSAEKVDANAVVEQQKKVDELRRLLLKSRLETRGQIEAVLTPEQRRQFRQLGPWWMRGAEDKD